MVSVLVTQVYPRKPKQVVLHVLPLLWHLLGSVSSAALKASTGTLVQSLYACMGNSLTDHASSNSNVTPKMTQLLQDFIDNPWRGVSSYDLLLKTALSLPPIMGVADGTHVLWKLSMEFSTTKTRSILRYEVYTGPAHKHDCMPIESCTW